VSEQKWPAGPWEVFAADDEWGWFKVIPGPQASGLTTTSTSERELAMKRLIAAAPTLFAALDAMVDASAALYKAGRLDAATFLQARDALRKAVGQ
jgi:hypothetical protein